MTGTLLGGGAMTYLTQLTVTSSYAADIVPALVAMGLGFGMIFAPAINTATAGVARQDSGVASALVNTMQQVGGSIGTAALSTVALTATASYLTAHHAGPAGPGHRRGARLHRRVRRLRRAVRRRRAGRGLCCCRPGAWLEELRNAAPAASPSLTDSVPAAGGAPAAPAAPAADPR